jgi:hypothetical protein
VDVESLNVKVIEVDAVGYDVDWTVSRCLDAMYRLLRMHLMEDLRKAANA